MKALKKYKNIASFLRRHVSFGGLAVFVFAALVATRSESAQVLDRVLAVIGDQAVLQSDLDRAMADIKKTPALAAAYRLEAQEVTTEKLLERMIEDRIIQQVVKEKGLAVEDAEVEKQISSIAQQNRLTRADLQRSLQNEGIPYEVYKTNIKAQLERRNLFDRELRSGGGVSEAELRSLYDRRAGIEMDMHLVTLPKGPANKSKLEKLVAAVKSGELSPPKALEQVPNQSLGWLSASELNPALKKTLGELNAAGAAGPVLSGGKLQVIVVTASRKGSEDEFTKVKDNLMMQAQAEDFEKRFSIWLERKKEEMQILRNKI